MFPNTQHTPTRPPQCPRHEQITFFIRRKFAPPERAVTFWLSGVFGATVPETTVHENGEFEFAENEIRFAKDFLIPSPAGDFIAAK
jgi:hypothetical protein